MSDTDVGTKDTGDNIKVSNLSYKAKKEINNNKKIISDNIKYSKEMC